MNHSSEGQEILRIGLRTVPLLEYVQSDPQLWSCTLLLTLAEQERTKLLEQSTVLSFRRNQVVLRSEAQANFLFFVLKGSVELSSKEGGIALAELGKGDFFNLAALFHDAIHVSASVSSPSGVQIALLPSSWLLSRVPNNASLGEVLETALALRNERAQECDDFYKRW